ncbi:MAG TPA: TrmH family RNA methyltransferase, partial [Sorangium sp.]|nr:TrmH family RNA methyltransferase [Sorangium sp.]
MPHASSRGGARSPSRRIPLRSALESVDPETVVAVLEPLVSARRREKILRVGAQRLDSVTVVMDAPHDPHNGAAVLRSCDAFGIQRVHVVERRQSFTAANAVSKGAERWVDVVHHGEVAAAVAALRQTGHTLIATHPEGKLLPAELAQQQRIALVMGNEHDGICEALAAACSQRVRVPMRGYVR